MPAVCPVRFPPRTLLAHIHLVCCLQKTKKRKELKKEILEKQKRKEERLSSGSRSFEEMLAYVDENGILHSTPEGVKPKEEIDVDYLCYSLMFYKVDGMINGATRKKLTQTAMKKMKIPLRNLVEQKNLVQQLI